MHKTNITNMIQINTHYIILILSSTNIYIGIAGNIFFRMQISTSNN